MNTAILRIGKLLADHPTLGTFGVSLAISLAIVAAIGTLLDHQQAFAWLRSTAIVVIR